MVERITPTIETITVNDKDYILKLYAKINIEGIQKIVVGIVGQKPIHLWDGQIDVDAHMDDTEEQLRSKLIEIIESL